MYIYIYYLDNIGLTYFGADTFYRHPGLSNVQTGLHSPGISQLSTHYAMQAMLNQVTQKHPTIDGPVSGTAAWELAALRLLTSPICIILQPSDTCLFTKLTQLKYSKAIFVVLKKSTSI